MSATLLTGQKPREPWLESVAARFGVLVLVVLSIVIGFTYWDGRGERQLAVMTVAAEIIAFAGLALARHHWRDRRGWACVGILLTAMAAAWCGATMFEKIAADTRAKAVAEAKERPAYVFAANAADIAARLLQERLERPEPRPDCVGFRSCPDTIKEWEASEAAAIDRLRNERDAAVAQMEAAIPEPALDWLAIARGVGVEVIKLLGFAAFGLLAPAAPAPPAAPRVRRPGLFRRIGSWFGLGALAASGLAAPAHAAPEPPQSANEAQQQDEAAPVAQRDTDLKRDEAPAAAPLRAKPKRKIEITDEAITRAVRRLQRAGSTIGYRKVAECMGVEPSRLYRSDAWKSKWASA